MKVVNVVGARPNFMKVAPLHRELENHPNFEPLVVHTGQHYDEQMSEVFVDELGLPEPDRYLKVGSDTHARQTAAIMVAFEQTLHELAPDLVVVVGDVNSTVACALVAQKIGVSVAHVEAGLRSFDRTMPEEINRVLTDQLAEYLFVSEPSGLENLAREGVPSDQIHFVGNVMIDSLVDSIEMARQKSGLETFGVTEGEYVLVTLHRPSNVDNSERLATLVDILCTAAERWPVIFPAHPRTRERLEDLGFDEDFEHVEHLHLSDPLSYLDFLQLMDGAGTVLTDSGGIQEETTILGIPCLTLRDSTERPVTVEMGTNELVPLDPETVLRKLEARMEEQQAGTDDPPPFWDGRAAERIVQVLEKWG